MIIRFQVGFPDTPNPVVGLWHALSRYLKQTGCLPVTFQISQIEGHAEKYHSTERLQLTSREVASLIVQRNLSGFHVYGAEHPRSATFNLSPGKESGRHYILNFGANRQAKMPDHWRPLIEEILTLYPAIGGWEWNSRYGGWQGDGEMHSSYVHFHGKVPTGMSRKTVKGDGIGPDRVFLDTSKNPGRWRALLGEIGFYASAEMWLGPHFWQYAKCTKDEALAADFFMEKRDTPNFLYLKCWPTPFTRPDGEQGRMQQRLWKLFFHEDCEWPPGSGTICDEPMYGPPELMPGYQPPTSA